MLRYIIHAIVILLITTCATAQQVVDDQYTPPKFTPHYAAGKGPTVVVDAAHNNRHTIDGGYSPFAKLLRQDGYTVTSGESLFTDAYLQNIKILVIVNAINEANLNSWRLPTPSAFTKEEIDVVNNWVKNGGSLLLIADHMPYAGAAQELAASFAYNIYNGFAMDTSGGNSADFFIRATGTLVNDALTTQIDTIATFTGSAFDMPGGAKSLLNFDGHYEILLPEQAWEFSKTTKRISAIGKSQLAYSTYGKGKVIMGGEAAMFTAQKVNNTSVGMNSTAGKNNYKLLLNMMHWLAE